MNKLFCRHSFLFLAAAAFLLLSAGGTRLQAVEILQARAQYYPEKSFKRISEYFTGVENMGRRAITRSRAEDRAGTYIVFKLDEKVAALPADASVQVELIDPADNLPKTFSMALPANRSKAREIFAGITGEDWPYDVGTRLLAWKVSLVDAAGGTLAEKGSFLWAMP